MGHFPSKLAYSTLCITADALDAAIWYISPDNSRRPKLFPTDVDSLSNEEIIHLLSEENQLGENWNIFKLTPCTVGKATGHFKDEAFEASALNLVFTKTNIPVPRVHRVIPCQLDHLVVMDYIKGPNLEEAWPSLPLWKKIHIAFILRRYVRQLRHLEASTETPPGPPSLLGAPQLCQSPIFGQMRPEGGPFPSYADLSEYFNLRHKHIMEVNNIPNDHPQWKRPFDDSSPLVFSHQDLNPRNIILGEDGRLWIIDWEWAGYYPRWFEYVAMKIQMKNDQRRGFYDSFWDYMIPFVCGPYFSQENWGILRTYSL